MHHAARRKQSAPIGSASLDPLTFNRLSAELAILVARINDPTTPHGAQQIVLSDDAVTILDEVGQQIEHLRLDRNGLAATPQLTAHHVKHVVAKAILHARISHAVLT